MKTAPARFTMIMLCIMTSLFGGCNAQWTTIRSGTYQGQPYIVQEREQSGLFASTNSLDWRIRLGKMDAVPVNANTTDWGPPYSTDIYGADAYLYITGKDTAYSNAPFTPGTIGVAHTMLYVSPSTLSEEQFETFYAFMKAEWPALSDSLTGKDLREFPHIIGLVYGAQDKYTRTFKGKHGGRAMVLRVDNDGRVRLAGDDKWQNEHYSGLSQKVQMPGKRIALDSNRTNGGLTIDSLSYFRDAGNTPVTAHFNIYPVADLSADTGSGH